MSRGHSLGCKLWSPTGRHITRKECQQLPCGLQRAWGALFLWRKIFFNEGCPAKARLEPSTFLGSSLDILAKRHTILFFWWGKERKRGLKKHWHVPHFLLLLPFFPPRQSKTAAGCGYVLPGPIIEIAELKRQVSKFPNHVPQEARCRLQNIFKGLNNDVGSQCNFHRRLLTVSLDDYLFWPCLFANSLHWGCIPLQTGLQTWASIPDGAGYWDLGQLWGRQESKQGIRTSDSSDEHSAQKVTLQ